MKKRRARKDQNASREDDAALWDHVAATVERVKTKKRVPDVEIIASADFGSPKPSKAPPALQPKSRKQKATTPLEPARPRPLIPSSPPPLADFDRRTARKVSKGRIDIEARIDLHGSRLDEAHGELLSFLRRCHADGKKMVLVITGKGRDSDDDRYRPLDVVSERRSRGVLRQQVPRWLDEPELRAIVTSYIEAAQHHGGAGALYVRLRRRAE